MLTSKHHKYPPGCSTAKRHHDIQHRLLWRVFIAIIVAWHYRRHASLHGTNFVPFSSKQSQSWPRLGALYVHHHGKLKLAFKLATLLLELVFSPTTLPWSLHGCREWAFEGQPADEQAGVLGTLFKRGLVLGVWQEELASDCLLRVR